MSEWKTLKIVYFGDSITNGQYIDPTIRFTAIVDSWLEEKYSLQKCSILSVNNSIPGETTRMALNRFMQDVQIIVPDILTIEFGLNDCNCWLTENGHPRVSPLAYKANITEMIERAKLCGVKKIILFTNHTTLRHKILLNGKSLEQNNRYYNTIVREIAHEMDVKLCDIEQAFIKETDTAKESYLLPAPDLLHLSAEGHAFYARALYPVVESAVQELISIESNLKTEKVS